MPLLSSGKKSGFLIFFDNKSKADNSFKIPGVDLRGKSLQEIIDSVERHMLVEALRNNAAHDKAAVSLKISKQALASKIKKFGINETKKQKSK